MLAPFECLCGNFILPEPASYVFFYALFNLRNLLYIIQSRFGELDKYESDYTVFNILGIEVWVEDDQLSEALKTLTEKKRNIILLSYFMDMSDSEISEFIKIPRSNVQYHRTKTLEAMRKIMEERK